MPYGECLDPLGEAMEGSRRPQPGGRICRLQVCDDLVCIHAVSLG